MKKTFIISMVLLLFVLVTCSSALSDNHASKDIIRSVQQALTDAGYSCGKADGIMGAKTKAAIAEYRKDNKLDTGDNIDDDLLLSLNLISNATTNTSASPVLNEYTSRAAIVVACTNRFATDVFSADGNDYDLSKFHYYGNKTGYYLTITSKGTSIENEDGSWRVEGLKMYAAHQITAQFDITANVKVEGNYYRVYNISGSAPSHKNASTLENESDFELFFVVPARLIPSEDLPSTAPTAPKDASLSQRSSSSSHVKSKDMKNSLPEHQARRAFEYYGEALYPYGFKCHWFTKLYKHEQYEDGSWYFKVGVTITNSYNSKREVTAEALINNTSQSVEHFSIH